MRAKCGLSADPKLVSATAMENDKTLIEELFDTMADNTADFALTFFHLSRLSNNAQTQPSEHENACRDLFTKPEQFDEWLVKWRKRLDEQTLSDDNRQAAMQAVNPIYIPRNHQIEAAIRAAEDRNDFSVFHELHDVLQNPYVIQEGKDKFMLPPKPDEVVVETFCGT